MIRTLFLSLFWKPVFLRWMRDVLEHEGGLHHDTATELARAALAEYLADQSIQFGDPNWGWQQPDARTVCHEYVMRVA